MINIDQMWKDYCYFELVKSILILLYHFTNNNYKLFEAKSRTKLQRTTRRFES